MIALVLEHLEALHLELMAIDPTHRTDAVDRVANIACDLRRTLQTASGMPEERRDRAAAEELAVA